VFPVKVSHNSFNFLVVHNDLNQCCALAWGSYADFHCIEVSVLCLALQFFSVVLACRSAESQTCYSLQTTRRAPALFWAAP
jgi:hypothetical protein